MEDSSADNLETETEQSVSRLISKPSTPTNAAGHKIQTALMLHATLKGSFGLNMALNNNNDYQS